MIFFVCTDIACIVVALAVLRHKEKNNFDGCMVVEIDCVYIHVSVIHYNVCVTVVTLNKASS